MNIELILEQEDTHKHNVGIRLGENYFMYREAVVSYIALQISMNIHLELNTDGASIKTCILVSLPLSDLHRHHLTHPFFQV